MHSTSINSTNRNSSNTSGYRYRGGVDSHGGGSMHMLDDSDSLLVALLARHLLDHGMAFLARYISTLLYGNLDRDLSGNKNTVGNRLVNTVDLRYLSVNGNTFFNRPSFALGLGHGLVDGCALSDWLGVAHSLGNRSGNSVALLSGDLDTNRNSCALGYSNGTRNLNRDLATLTLSLSLAVGRGSSNSYGAGSNRDRSGSNWYSWGNGIEDGALSEEELCVSIGVGISFSFSICFTLNNSVLSGNDSRSSSTYNSTSRGNVKASSIQRQSSKWGSSRGNTIDGGKWKSGVSSSNMSNRNSLSSNMSNKTGRGVNMNLSLDTRLSDNINTLGGVAGLGDSLGLCSTLLLLRALLDGHHGALLLGNLGDNGVALGNCTGGAHLLRNRLQGGGTLLHISGGTLLLRYRLECGGTVLDTSGGTLLLALGTKQIKVLKSGI